MIRFDYRLTGTGWSEATVADDVSTAMVTASYLTDALGDLLGAVRLLLAGATEARCSWEEEPGEFRWVFRRGQDEAQLRLLGFDDVHLMQPDTAGQVVFETTQPLIELAGVIAAGAQRVLDRYGTDGYLARWCRHPFPAENLASIQRHLAA